MSHIEVNTLYLRNLATRTRGIESTLRQFSGLAGNAFQSSPKVRSAYSELGNRWDMRRDELADALAAIADGLDTTWRAFQDTDQQLADALDGESTT